MLDELVGQDVVIDMKSPFVCLGKLVRLGEHFLELRDADLHDLRDTATSRENYVAASLTTAGRAYTDSDSSASAALAE